MPEASRPLDLDDNMRDAIATAFATGNFITVAYNGDDGWPRISRRGTTQVFGDGQLALWARKPDEGLAKAIETRPELTLSYMDLVQRGVIYNFYGRARVSDDAADHERVWAASPEREQAQDPERKGVAVIVDLERIVAQGRQPEQNFVMERAPG